MIQDYRKLFPTWQVIASFIVFVFYIILFVLFIGHIRPNKQNQPIKSTNPKSSSQHSKNSVPTVDRYFVYLAEFDDPNALEAGSVTLSRIPKLGGEKQVLTKFSSPVKQIKLLDSSRLVYITNPDIMGLGDAIRLRNLATGSDTAFYTPPKTFMIDSFIVSPDGNTLVVWLVAPTVDGFKNGFSRIIMLPMSTPAQTKVLTEEKMVESVRYPLFWSIETNRMYFGLFTPGGSTNNGVVSTDSDGNTAKKIEPGLGKDQYGGSIVLSPSGRYIAFNRQTNRQTSNLADVGVLFPSSVRNTNAVVIHDLKTSEETTLEENTQGAVLSDVVWGDNDQTLYWIENRKNGDQYVPANFISYALTSKRKQTIGKNAQGEIITSLGGGVTLIGMRSELFGNLGGIGTGVSSVYNGYYALSPDNSYKKVYTDNPSQLISIL